jgi:hypothetical protein
MKTLKIIILFVVILSGCSHKYVDVEGRSLDDKIIASWEELDCKIVEQDEQGFSLGLQVRDIIVVGDSIKAVEPYNGMSMLGDVKSGPSVGDRFFGCLGVGAGCTLGVLGLMFSGGPPMIGASEPPEIPASWTVGCITAAGIGALVAVASASVVSKGSKSTPVGKGGKRLGKDCIYTMCTGSNALVRKGTPLMVEKVKIVVENTNFEKTYWTDENGNIKLKFEDIIPEPLAADSVLNLIIHYYELVDTVEVKCSEKLSK